jgi:NitT/TauT family transport system substrate-binding protein
MGDIMGNRRNDQWSRREFLSKLSLAGGASILGLRSESVATEPPPETTSIRIVQVSSTCFAPQYVAEELLRADGFSQVQYIKPAAGEPANSPLVSGRADVTMQFSAPNIVRVEKNDPIVILAGVHVGCFEVFGNNQVRAIRDLKGKTVAVPSLGGPQHVFLSTMGAYVGLNPNKDIKWVVHPFHETMRLLAEGKIDAFLGFPPQPQELRAKKIGHVIMNSMMDRPWSQYFCCMVNANREFVRKHPVATKRVLRAILKGADICAREPERVARFLVDKGYTENYEYAFETLKDIPYGKWRDYDPEDTVRFYALRLQEVGMIKSSPQKIISQGTDWRFLRELKKELKA